MEPRTHRRLLRALAPLFLLGAARADVLVVDDDGPADFAQINAAVAAASNGDTILVRSGTYAPVPIIGRVVDVVADEGADVLVDGYVAVADLPAGRTVLLSGLHATAALDTHYGLLLQNNLGSIRVQDCSFTGYQPPVGSYDGFTRLESGGTGARIADCEDVSIVRTEITGGEGQTASSPAFCLCYSGDGGIGLASFHSQIALSGCTVTGGMSGVASYGGLGGPGMYLVGTTTFVGGSTVRGGDGGSIQDVIPLCEGGGTGIRTDASSLLRLLDVTVEGGEKSPFAGMGGDCDDGEPFAGDGTVVHLAPNARSMVATPVLREGETVQLTFTGEPGDTVYLGFSYASGHLYIPQHNGAWLLFYPPLISTTPIGTIDASGVLTSGYVAGPVADGKARRRHLQAIHLHPRDGRVLGPPSHVVVLDDSF